MIITRFGGPTIVGEWTVADTDCGVYLNSVGEGYVEMSAPYLHHVELAGRELIVEVLVLAFLAFLVVPPGSIVHVLSQMQMPRRTPLRTQNS